MGANVNTQLILPHLSDSGLKTLFDTAKSTAFAEITGGNHHSAKSIRAEFDAFLSAMNPPARRAVCKP